MQYISTKDAFINTTNKSVYDQVYDFISLIEKIVSFIGEFKTIKKIISIICSAASFVVPSSSLVRTLVEILLESIEKSIFSSLAFAIIKESILAAKKFFS